MFTKWQLSVIDAFPVFGRIPPTLRDLSSFAFFTNEVQQQLADGEPPLTALYAGLIISLGRSGSGKSRYMGLARDETGLPYISCGEPLPGFATPLSTERYATQLFEAAVRRLLKAGPGAQSVARALAARGLDAAGRYDDLDIAARATRLEDWFNDVLAGTDPAWLRPEGHYIDSLSGLAYTASGAATAGGYPRELPLQLLAVNNCLVTLDRVALAAFNPFATDARDLSLVETMVDGSTMGFLFMESGVQADLGFGTLGRSGAGQGPTMRLTGEASFSYRPLHRGDRRIKNITYSL